MCEQTVQVCNAQTTKGKCGSRIKAGFLNIFLLFFSHKWMFLSTMQTLPDQIRFGPAEMISLLSFSV